MKTYEERPYVVCHMLSAVNGKIDGEYFKAPELIPVRKESDRIRDGYGCNAVLCGAVTAAEIYADGFLPQAERNAEESIREDYTASMMLRDFAVCIDTEGRLNWKSNTVNRHGKTFHVVEVLTEDVGDGYLRFLEERDISYIFAGKSELDVGLLLRKLKKLLGVNWLLVSGGGIMNWTFLQAGFIDELSLVICPLVDGATDTATIFDRSDYLTRNVTAAFSLADVKRLDGDGIWLNYKPKNTQ